MIFTNSGNKRPVEDITLPGVNRKQAEDLAEYLRRKLSEDESLTLRKIEERSGGRITHSYLSKILNRVVKVPSIPKLKAIAKGLGVTEDEVFAVARGKSLQEEEAVDAEMALFASRVKKLTPQQKRDFKIAWQMANDLLDRLEKEKEAKAEDR